MTSRELFLITVRPERGIDPVIAVRLLLKYARRLGLTCVTITTAPGDAEHAHAPPMLIDGTAERVTKKMAGHDQ